MTYRFQELGWLLFQEVIDAVVARHAGAEAVEWRGAADVCDRRTTVGAGLALPGLRALPGPTSALVLWRPGTNVWSLIDRGLQHEYAAGSVLFATDDPTGELADQIAVALGASPVAVLDGPRLAAVLDEDALIRRRVPFVLGVRELDGLVDEDVVARSTLDVAAAHDLARVFVTTRAYRSTVDVLERHAFAVVSGPPETGKTAIARTVALARLTEGWEAHECVRPEQLWERYDPERPQIFIADDAFGSTEYRPDAADRWALDLPRVLGAMDERHWLIWTSRPAPLRAGLARVHREHGVERFPQPAEVHVDAADLDVGERAAMLFRHARASQVPLAQVAVIRGSASTIVGHPHLTPERIRRFVTQRLPQIDGGARRMLPVGLRRLVAAEIREPTAAMTASFAALPEAHRALLLALLDQPPGPVAERELAIAARRHLEGGLPRPPGELVDALTDHFLRVVPPQSVTWVHPSWRDVAIEALAADEEQRQRFLHACEVDGLALALSVAGGAAGARSLPLLVTDADWDALADRLHEVLRAGSDEDVVRLLDVLEAALAAPLGERAEAEVVALAEHALDMAGRRLDERAPPAPVDLLVGWLELGTAVGQAVVHPAVIGAWIELVPTMPAFLEDPAEHPRYEAWARLARSLRQHSYETFERLGGSEAMLCTVPERRPPPRAADLTLQEWVRAEEPAEPAIGLLPEMTRGDDDLVRRVLRDLTPRGDGGASGAPPERPRPSPPAMPPVAGPAARGSAERTSSRPGRASPHRVRRRRPGSPPAR